MAILGNQTGQEREAPLRSLGLSWTFCRVSLPSDSVVVSLPLRVLVCVLRVCLLVRARVYEYA